MTSEVKLLTVQMAEALGAMSPEARVRMLRERGLIALEPEPVDVLALAIQHCFDDFRWGYTPEQVAITAKVAREWCRPAAPLTRMELREAIMSAGIGERLNGHDLDRLHAALTDAKGGE